jgi:hypothetical protein
VDKAVVDAADLGTVPDANPQIDGGDMVPGTGAAKSRISAPGRGMPQRTRET